MSRTFCNCDSKTVNVCYIKCISKLTNCSSMHIQYQILCILGVHLLCNFVNVFAKSCKCLVHKYGSQ